MTTNPTSMTISPENDTKDAAKQVLTFFFFGEHPTTLDAPGMVVIAKKEKKKVRTSISDAKCVKTQHRHPQLVVVSSSVPFLITKIW